MTIREVRIAEICVRLAVDEAFVQRACDEGLIAVRRAADDERVLSVEDAERLRLITVLMREMDVNLAGAEVILHMREDFCALQRQFDEVLRELVGELRRRMER